MDWPTADDLAKRLDITSSDWSDDLDRLVAAGVQWVKTRVGEWDEDDDEPDEALAQAALERAVEYATNGDGAPPVKSESLLIGHRRRFATA